MRYCENHISPRISDKYQSSGYVKDKWKKEDREKEIRDDYGLCKGKKRTGIKRMGSEADARRKSTKAEKGSPTQERTAVLELLVIWRGTGEVVNERERLVCVPEGSVSTGITKNLTSLRRKGQGDWERYVQYHSNVVQTDCQP